MITTIKHADILQRTVARGQHGFVGVIFGPDLDKLEEGPGYLMRLDGESLIINHTKVLDRPSSYDEADIGYILTSPEWRSTSMPGATTIRTMPMGGGQNGLIVYGANMQPLVDPIPGKEDTLARFRNGQMIVEKADPSVTLGSALSQTLRESGLFTNPVGQRLYLPALTSPARATMREIHGMTIKLARAEITDDEFQTWAHADKSRYSLSRASHNEKGYLQYLLNLDALSSKSGISIDLTQCMTEEVHEKFQKISRKAFDKAQETKHDTPTL